MRVRVAQSDLVVMIDRFQHEHGLSDVETLQALSSWQTSCLKYMLRKERHGDDASPADEPIAASRPSAIPRSQEGADADRLAPSAVPRHTV